MPGLAPGINVFLFAATEDVDGRDKPGHDECRIHSMNFTLTDICILLSRPHPRSPRDVLEAILNVNGERRLRPRFAIVIPGGLGNGLPA
jgi:hypothetical protein